VHKERLAAVNLSNGIRANETRRLIFIKFVVPLTGRALSDFRIKNS
jgi:hypothetical protein